MQRWRGSVELGNRKSRRSQVWVYPADVQGDERLSRLVQALQDPRRYPHDADRVEVITTHISHVLLAGSYAGSGAPRRRREPSDAERRRGHSAYILDPGRNYVAYSPFRPPITTRRFRSPTSTTQRALPLGRADANLVAPLSPEYSEPSLTSGREQGSEFLNVLPGQELTVHGANRVTWTEASRRRRQFWNDDQDEGSLGDLFPLQSPEAARPGIDRHHLIDVAYVHVLVVVLVTHSPVEADERYPALRLTDAPPPRTIASGPSRDVRHDAARSDRANRRRSTGLAPSRWRSPSRSRPACRPGRAERSGCCCPWSRRPSRSCWPGRR